MKVDVKDKRGKVFGLHHKVAKVLVAKGVLSYAEKAPPGYQTRMLMAAPPDAPAAAPAVVPEPVVEEPDAAAPYGYKADGTPRLRPGRRSSAAE